MRFETSNRLKFEIFILLLSSTIDKNSMNDNMKKIKFVVNPISGTQSKELILSLLEKNRQDEILLGSSVYGESRSCGRDSCPSCGRKNGYGGSYRRRRDNQ